MSDSGVVSPSSVRFQPMRVDALGDVVRIESQMHAHPWTLGNFADSVRSGYLAQRLEYAPPSGAAPVLLGYLVVMMGVDEAHLLNITVAPEYQGQGWARYMLVHMQVWAQQQGAHTLWLEVRESNARARQVYERCGFERVGVRKNYYPAGAGGAEREHAVVMRWMLATRPEDDEGNFRSPLSL